LICKKKFARPLHELSATKITWRHRKKQPRWRPGASRSRQSCCEKRPSHFPAKNFLRMGQGFQSRFRLRFRGVPPRPGAYRRMGPARHRTPLDLIGRFPYSPQNGGPGSGFPGCGAGKKAAGAPEGLVVHTSPSGGGREILPPHSSTYCSVLERKWRRWRVPEPSRGWQPACNCHRQRRRRRQSS